MGGNDDEATAYQRSARSGDASSGGAVKRRAEVGRQSLGGDGCVLPAKRARFADGADAGATSSDSSMGGAGEGAREDIGAAVTCDAEGSHSPRAHREGRKGSGRRRQTEQRAGSCCSAGDGPGALPAPAPAAPDSRAGYVSGRAYRCATSPERSDGVGSAARGAPLSQPAGAIVLCETAAAPHPVPGAATVGEFAASAGSVGDKAAPGIAAPCTHNESTHAFIAGVARAAAEAAYASTLAAVYRSFGCTCAYPRPSPTQGPPAAHRQGRSWH
jgi:hypothetical protein